MSRIYRWGAGCRDVSLWSGTRLTGEPAFRHDGYSDIMEMRGAVLQSFSPTPSVVVAVRARAQDLIALYAPGETSPVLGVYCDGGDICVGTGRTSSGNTYVPEHIERFSITGGAQASWHWHHFQVGVFPGSSGKQIRLIVDDGVLDITREPDLEIDADQLFGGLSIGEIGSFTSAGAAFWNSPAMVQAFSDVIVDTADFPGVHKVIQIPITGDGDISEWKNPDGADCYRAIHTIPQDYHKKIVTAQRGKKALFKIQAPVTGTIHGVTLFSSARRVGSVRADKMKHLCRVSGTDHEYGEMELPATTVAPDVSTGWQWAESHIDTNPETGELWGNDDLANAQFGIVSS